MCKLKQTVNGNLESANSRENVRNSCYNFRFFWENIFDAILLACSSTQQGLQDNRITRI